MACAGCREGKIANRKDTTMKTTAAVKVTPETYIRAETDRQFTTRRKMAGGVNACSASAASPRWTGRTVVRMNKDTLYSVGVVDTSKGATITVPLPPGSLRIGLSGGQRSLLSGRDLRSGNARTAQEHPVPRHQRSDPGIQPGGSGRYGPGQPVAGPVRHQGRQQRSTARSSSGTRSRWPR